MQIEQAQLLGLHTEIYLHISTETLAKQEEGEESNHLCIAEVSQETVAQHAMDQACQKHTCSKNLRLFTESQNVRGWKEPLWVI